MRYADILSPTGSKVIICVACVAISSLTHPK
jgi:hypothetical protein